MKKFFSILHFTLLKISYIICTNQRKAVLCRIPTKICINRRIKKKAVITVIGKDSVGILAKVSEACSKADVNIVEVTQSVLQDMFAMIMLVEIDKSNIGFEQLRTNLKAVGESTNTKVHVMHEDIFNSMHRI